MSRGRSARALALGVLMLATPATLSAEPLAAVTRTQLDASLPAELTVTKVHLTARLAALDVDPATVTIAWPRAPRVGTASVQLRWAGRQSRFVPVTLAVRADEPEVAPVALSSTPLPRGTRVTFEVRQGAVRVTGQATLERAARVGAAALIRLQADRPPVAGVLVAADRVVVGGTAVTP